MVVDNRGLAVRDIAYYRHPDALDTTQTRITHHQHDTRGYLKRSVDPRLQESGKTNFNYLTDLAGQVLRVQGVDNGTTVNFSDAEDRDFITISNLSTAANGSEDSSQAVVRTWQYEEALLPGRPLSITEQVSGGTARITERFVYASNTEIEKAQNIAGQCIRHCDTIGLMQTDSISLTGVSLSVSRRLLKDADNPDVVVDWKGDNISAWNEQLNNESYITLTTADATGAMLTTTDSKGHIQRLAYDVSGMMLGSWLTLKGGIEKIIVKSLTYSAAGEKLREEHGNGVVTTYSYEPETQRLLRIKTQRLIGHILGAKILQDLRYEYDSVGNVLKISNDAEETRFWRNQKVVPENTYVYDSLYQLVSATGREMANTKQQNSNLPFPTVPFPSDNSAYTNYTRTYTYDKAGNLTQVRHSAPATSNNYTTNITVSNSSNRSVQSTLTESPSDVDSFFTVGGQQEQLQPGQQLAWTPRNELLKVTPVIRDSGIDDTESYRYDGGSQRLQKVSRQKTANSVQTLKVLYLLGIELHTTTLGETQTESLQVLTIGEAGRAQVRVLHWERGKPEGISNDQIRYSYDNLIGSSSLEINNTGNVLSMEEYYPYGGTAILMARNEIEVSYKTIRYSGEERDATGLYYYGYRYYQPWIGRWLSSDPAGTIDGLNLFRMVRNNPVNFFDSNGLAPEYVHKSYDRMVNKGEVWSQMRTQKSGYAAIKDLSKKNEKELKKMSLSSEEKKFVKNFTKLPSYAVHFTNKDIRNSEGDLELLSRVQLSKNKVNFAKNNTEQLDLEQYATNDFVFTSLELGDTPKKSRSRFGNIRFRANIKNIDSSSFKYSHMEARDLATYDERPVTEAPEWLAKKDVGAFFNGKVKKEQTITDMIFFGENMLDSLGRLIVKDLREFSATTRQNVLSITDASKIDSVVNSMYRPQIVFPHSLKIKKGKFDASIPKSTSNVVPHYYV